MPNGKAIAILGAKGGVGTTTIAANLAAELATNPDRSIVLVDLNLFLGDVGLHVGVESGPTVMGALNSETTDASELA
jgi:pilus assembly protein CpaE